MATEDAGRRAGRVQQHCVGLAPGGPRPDIALYDVGRKAGALHIGAEPFEPFCAGIDRNDVPSGGGKLHRFPAGCGAEIESWCGLRRRRAGARAGLPPDPVPTSRLRYSPASPRPPDRAAGGDGAVRAKRRRAIRRLAGSTAKLRSIGGGALQLASAASTAGRPIVRPIARQREGAGWRVQEAASRPVARATGSHGPIGAVRRRRAAGRSTRPRAPGSSAPATAPARSAAPRAT